MPIHDQYLRRTPLERILPDDDFPAERLVPIAEEMETRGIDPGDPGAFAMLDATGAAVDALRRTEDGAEQRHQLAVVLFHVFHLMHADRRHTLVSTAAARWAVEAAAPADRAAPSVDGPDARYVQLPQHLFWVRDPDADAPATLDGYFRTQVGDDVVILGVMGVHGPGVGFSVLPLPPLPLADAPLWDAETMREAGDDFRSEMPGSELENLYELRTAGELLKLVARLDRLETGDEGVVRPADPPAADAGPPEPSRLPYDRLDLD